MTKDGLTDVAGIGPATARTLEEHGIATVHALATASSETLGQIPGFGTARVAAVTAAAGALLPAAPHAEKTDGPAKAKKKKKKKKKEKKKSGVKPARKEKKRKPAKGKKKEKKANGKKKKKKKKS